MNVRHLPSFIFILGFSMMIWKVVTHNPPELRQQHLPATPETFGVELMHRVGRLPDFVPDPEVEYLKIAIKGDSIQLMDDSTFVVSPGELVKKLRYYNYLLVYPEQSITMESLLPFFERYRYVRPTMIHYLAMGRDGKLKVIEDYAQSGFIGCRVGDPQKKTPKFELDTYH